MIGIRHRFHGYNSLRDVYRRGQTLRASGLSLKFARRGQKRPYRVAVVVSRKVSKSAVVRNRIRRRIYETVRLDADKIEPGLDLVFTVFEERLADMPITDLQSAISGLLQKTAASR